MKREIILIQPKTSLTGSFIKMLPIGLLYASSKIVKENIAKVIIIDARLNGKSWEKKLDELVNDKTIIVGLTVMTGSTILESIKISRYIKNKWPKIKVVWGGAHPSFSSDDILQEKSVDYVIRGYGSKPFHDLTQHLLKMKGLPGLENIKGLSWRDSNELTKINPTDNAFEHIYYKDIPYQLLSNLSDYKHIDSNEIVFPMYSVMGCPYKCTFCSSPAQYKNIKKKWQPFSITEVAEHIKMVNERYRATFIYFIDDDSFVDLKHVEKIMIEINRLRIKVKLGFRGVRISEVAKMSDDFLVKLVEAGTNNLHIGVESGSDRILSLIKKDTTVNQIIEVNRKLANYKDLKVFYNFIVGFPTETMEETKMTRDFILRLIKDNPSCIVIPLNKPRPLPGTELYNLAIKHGYIPPKTLEEWGEYDVESSDYNPLWLSDEHNQFIRMMFLSMYFIDNKLFKLTEGNMFRYKLLKVLAFLYNPIALYRFKKGFYQLLIEDKIYSFCKWLL